MKEPAPFPPPQTLSLPRAWETLHWVIHTSESSPDAGKGVKVTCTGQWIGLEGSRQGWEGLKVGVGEVTLD